MLTDENRQAAAALESMLSALNVPCLVEDIEINISILREKLNLGFAGKGKDEMYLRLTLTDEQGDKAYTRAYFLREVFDL